MILKRPRTKPEVVSAPTLDPTGAVKVGQTWANKDRRAPSTYNSWLVVAIVERRGGRFNGGVYAHLDNTVLKVFVRLDQLRRRFKLVHDPARIEDGGD